MEFLGKNYVLNQCEDIWDWFEQSRVGEYTRYYSRVAFHTESGFFAAPADNLDDYSLI